MTDQPTEHIDREAVAVEAYRRWSKPLAECATLSGLTINQVRAAIRKATGKR